MAATMTETPLNPTAFARGSIADFPLMRCCNCGVRGGLSLVAQETKGSGTLPFEGSGVAFRLHLPVCESCEKSLSRRPPALTRSLLLLLAIAGALSLIALALGPDVLPRFHTIFGNVFVSSLVVAALLLLALHGARMPTGKQTSYYQPVRIGRLKRTLLSGEIQGICFKFTNPAYLRDFAETNKAAIKAGHIQVAQT